MSAASPPRSGQPTGGAILAALGVRLRDGQIAASSDVPLSARSLAFTHCLLARYRPWWPGEALRASIK